MAAFDHFAYTNHLEVGVMLRKRQQHSNNIDNSINNNNINAEDKTRSEVVDNSLIDELPKSDKKKSNKCFIC